MNEFLNLMADFGKANNLKPRKKQSKKEWLLCLFNKVGRLRQIAIENNYIDKKIQADRLENMIAQRLNEITKPADLCWN
jgi:hypothetical protein